MGDVSIQGGGNENVHQLQNSILAGAPFELMSISGRFPRIQGHVYMETKPNKWQKRFFVLKGSKPACLVGWMNRAGCPGGSVSSVVRVTL